MNISQIKHNISEPVPSVRTPFLPNGDIDWRGLDNVVEFLVEEAKVKTLLLTNGDSLWSVLSDDEVAAVTKRVVEQNKGRAMVIAGGKNWCTKKNLEFFSYAKELGADIGGLLLADWAQSVDDKNCIEAVREAGKIMPVMVLTNLMNGRGFPLSVFKKIVDEKTPGFIGIKDDMCGVYGRRLATILKGEYAFLSGGRAENHLDVAHYGADGYLSIFVSFLPQLSREYWRLFTEKDYVGCAEWIKNFEFPFMDMISSNGLNFDAVVHGMMEIEGICGRYRRAPYTSLSDAQMEILREYRKSLEI